MAEANGVDYGPLAGLIGRWQGDSGMDVSPEPDGDEHNPFYETIVFSAAGDVTNAEQQTLAVVRYHQEVRRKSDDQVFHDQIGYWYWDAEANLVMQSLVIPRAVSLLAGGRATEIEGGWELRVQAGADGFDIAQSPFMAEHASTTAFTHQVRITGNTLTYQETTTLSIYGKTGYPHTDENTLTRQ